MARRNAPPANGTTYTYNAEKNPTRKRMLGYLPPEQPGEGITLTGEIWLDRRQFDGDPPQTVTVTVTAG